jgi:hypothetical protein
MRIHTGSRPFVCDYPECGATFKESAHLAVHKRIHADERPFPCDVPGCGATFNIKNNLRYHTMLHNNIRPFACGIEGCEAKFVRADYLKRHLEWNYTEKGAQRRKKKEEQVAKYLTSVGVAYDRELRIDFCGDGGEKKFARIDFTIHGEDRTIPVEVDEDSHEHYGVGCDVARMMNVAAQHFAQEGPTLPLHFIRYNPDGYSVNGRKQTPTMAARHLELMRAIDLPVTAPLTITYMCYPTTDGVADAINSPEFPAHLREVCRTVVP